MQDLTVVIASVDLDNDWNNNGSTGDSLDDAPGQNDGDETQGTGEIVGVGRMTHAVVRLGSSATEGHQVRFSLSSGAVRAWRDADRTIPWDFAEVFTVGGANPPPQYIYIEGVTGGSAVLTATLLDQGSQSLGSDAVRFAVIRQVQDVDYFEHWTDTGIKWADGTLAFEILDQTGKDSEIKVTLDIEKAPNAAQNEFDEIKDFQFTFAGRLNGGTWQNLVLDSALTMVSETHYRVEFTYLLEDVESFEFDLYAEQGERNFWGEQIPGRPSKKHGTLWMLSGGATWEYNAHDIAPVIALGSLSSDQAQRLVEGNYHVPIRNVDHP